MPDPNLALLLQSFVVAARIPERHPDLFTPEEALAYLHLAPDSHRMLKSYRDKGWLIGHTCGPDGALMYYRDDLNACVLRMAGRLGQTEVPRTGGPSLRSPKRLRLVT